MLTNLFYLLLLFTGFFSGLILAKLCKDEIKAWRKRLFMISIISLILILLLVLIPLKIYEYRLPTIITLLFIAIVDLTIIWKSY